MKLFRRLAAALVLFGALLVAGMAWAYPALGATVCSGCYGLERIAPGLAVERLMDARARRALLIDVKRAR